MDDTGIVYPSVAPRSYIGGIVWVTYPRITIVSNDITSAAGISPSKLPPSAPLVPYLSVAKTDEEVPSVGSLGWTVDYQSK